MKSFSMKVLTRSAFLIALSILLSRFFSISIPLGGVEALRIGFGTFPIVLSGFLFGPLMGAIVGGIANLLGLLIRGVGAPLPHFVLVAALGGACPVIFWKILGSKRSYWGLFFPIALSLFLNSVILISFFMHDLFGVPYGFMIPGRLIAWAITAPFYPFFILKLWKSFSR